MRRRDLFALAALPLSARPIAWQSRLASLEKQIPQWLRETRTPGLSMALVVDAKILYARGFGVKDTGTKAPVTPQTMFEAASMSKPVFAYAVMQLVQDGTLDLDAPLVRYGAPPFLTGDDRISQITTRHVLTHSTGFPNWRSGKQPLAIQFQPGEKYSYSSEGLYYLQTVVTHLKGHASPKPCGRYEGGVTVCATDIGDYLHRKLLRPFGMSSSTYTWNALCDKQMARGHDGSGKPLQQGKATAADAARYASAGGLLTTPSDYARLLIEVLRPPSGRPGRLSQKNRDEMIRPQMAVEKTPEYAISWALGWRVITTKDGAMIGHGGDNAGFHCFAQMSVPTQCAFVIMTNGDNGVEPLKRVAAVLPISSDGA